MITAITLENFKGIGASVRIPLRPITLMFGANSSGKSTIIQAIHYTREILQNRNTDVDLTSLGGDSIDLGGFRNLVHKHDLDRPITLRFDLDLTDLDLPLNWYASYALVGEESTDVSRYVNSAWIELIITFSRILDYPVLKTTTIGINDDAFARLTSSIDQKSFTWEYNAAHPLWDIQSDEPLLWRSALPEYESVLWAELLIGPSDQPSGATTALPLWEDVPLVIQKSESEHPSLPAAWVPVSIFVLWFSQLVTGPTKILLGILNNFRYLGPIRSVPERNHQPAITPDESRWADGTAAWDALYRKDDQTLIIEVHHWMSDERLKTGYSIVLDEFREIPLLSPLSSALGTNTLFDDIENISKEFNKYPVRTRLRITENENFLELQPSDIGVGISQVVPVLVIALDSWESIIAIEQPELHLHPAMQAELGDLFIQSAVGQLYIESAGKTNNQFLIETHSEHIILRILRRIRETSANQKSSTGPITPNDVSLLFISKDVQGTTVTNLRIDKHGRIVDRVPGGFFEEGFAELF
jgi:hypothetical protein